MRIFITFSVAIIREFRVGSSWKTTNCIASREGTKGIEVKCTHTSNIPNSTKHITKCFMVSKNAEYGRKNKSEKIPKQNATQHSRRILFGSWSLFGFRQIFSLKIPDYYRSRRLVHVLFQFGSVTWMIETEKKSDGILLVLRSNGEKRIGLGRSIVASEWLYAWSPHP